MANIGKNVCFTKKKFCKIDSGLSLISLFVPILAPWLQFIAILLIDTDTTLQMLISENKEL
jgi:hypothetical protein